MTETRMNPNPAAEEEQPRCQAARKTDHACWREATERMFPEDERLTLCAEHYHAQKLAWVADELCIALEKMNEWIAAEVQSSEETVLQRHAYDMRVNVEAEYWRALLASRAAHLIASQRKGEPRLTPEQAKRFAELSLRSDALADAQTTLEDAPDEVLGFLNRWAIIGALNAMKEEVNEEHERCKREIGLK